MNHPLDPFLRESRRYLTEEYPGKIGHALARLSAEDLWWRPNESSNAIGNLIVHLAGNVRQWIVHGLGGEPDVRDRAAEFARRGSENADQLMVVLRAAVDSAGGVLAAEDPARLHEPVTIQGLATTRFAAVYHVVEHFSMHTGQILWMVKARVPGELGFYEIGDDGEVLDTRW